MKIGKDLRTFNTGDYNEKESLIKYKFKRIQRTFFLQRKDNFFGFKMRFVAQLLQYEKTLEAITDSFSRMVNSQENLYFKTIC